MENAAQITTDYLIVGAGISSLSFADELLTSSDYTITIVDKRHAPGGHWNDSYPFVKLHQPASFYGVESTELSNDAVDQDGPNKGFSSLSTGPQITAYCHAVMRDRLIPSGRVTFLPVTEYKDGRLHNLLSGKRAAVKVRRKLVDATYYTNSIPSRHKRAFNVDASVTCIPPNDLPAHAGTAPYYTVLGGGKTGMDACLWLLQHGADPASLTWVIPRDPWCVNRASVQPGEEHFLSVFNMVADTREDIAAATSATDLAHRHEKSRFWLRLDPNVEPSAYRGATISEGEMAQLRSIKTVIRKGYVRAIEPDRLVLTRGDVSAPSKQTLYIDCTASAISPRPAVPIFQPNKIVLQMVRIPQIPYSCAYLAFVECQGWSNEKNNSVATPMSLMADLTGYIMGTAVDFANRRALAKEKVLREWNAQSRLDGFQQVVGNVDGEDREKIELLMRVREANARAARNLPRLVKSLEERPRL